VDGDGLLQYQMMSTQDPLRLLVTGSLQQLGGTHQVGEQ
jgi:hypothetical protein